MSRGLTISKVISTFVEDTKRKVKVYLTGLINVQSAHQVAPYGVDSNPVADMKAIYGSTEVNGRPVIIGYINKNVLAEVGELRLFATNETGTLQRYIWLTNDGFIEIGGSSKHMVRFEELKVGFDQLKSDLNALVTKFNSHTHTGVTTGGGVSGATATPASSSTASIDDSKIDEIKTL